MGKQNSGKKITIPENSASECGRALPQQNNYPPPPPYQECEADPQPRSQPTVAFISQQQPQQSSHTPMPMSPQNQPPNVTIAIHASAPQSQPHHAAFVVVQNVGNCPSCHHGILMQQIHPTAWALCIVCCFVIPPFNFFFLLWKQNKCCNCGWTN